MPTGIGCPAGVCTGLRPDIGGGSCTGPSCAATLLPPARDSAAPAEVEFSALRCLACANPDLTALRKAALGVQQRRGRIELKFCVDRAGQVERSSINVRRSFGLAAVDRVTIAAIERWRFSPLKIAGAPRRACSSATFELRID